MSMTSIDEAKARARALRAALAEAGTAISHAQALELVAKQEGARDWNTLHARLTRSNGAPLPLRLDGRVEGQYLGQPFTGRITRLARMGEGHSVTIKLDQAVDVVRFESFSNLRSVITGTLDAEGRSPRVTSDGVPQLIVRALPD